MGGQGYGPGMMGGQGACQPGGGQDGAVNQEAYKKFFEATTDLRRQIHNKTFDLREAYGAGNEEAARTIEQEIDALQEQVAKKAEEAGINTNNRGFGPRGGGHGSGPGMMGR
jgi:hypothetical protein